MVINQVEKVAQNALAVVADSVVLELVSHHWAQVTVGASGLHRLFEGHEDVIQIDSCGGLHLSVAQYRGVVRRSIPLKLRQRFCRILERMQRRILIELPREDVLACQPRA